MLSKIKIIILFAALALMLSHAAAYGAALNNNNNNWVWNVVVIPPDDGWNTNRGKSIQASLKWEEDEVAQSGRGVAGHDLKFIDINDLAPREEGTLINPPVSVSNNNLRALSSENLNNARLFNILRSIASRPERIIAVISFAGTETNRALIAAIGGNRALPLFLAYGEDVLIELNNQPVFNVFALDLFRDYRSQAFALHAANSLKPDARIALAASRFTLNQEREAKLCYRYLELNKFVPMPFWLDASVRNAFDMIAQEIESSADGTVITFLGGMAAREMWRNFMRVRTSWHIWNCSEPDDMYLSFKGMLFADQNLFLFDRGGFNALRRSLWSTRAVRISDNIAAGRAHAIVEWLKRAIFTLADPQPLDFININRVALINTLARVQNIPFGNQNLTINPRTHRPVKRKVFIADIDQHAYRFLDELEISSMPYIDLF
ncbi:MAG: hypothetical protein IJ667_12380 [Synergistaceae bacterium]|nr:hypothetical protein [Synergistaceae bacterium]